MFPNIHARVYCNAGIETVGFGPAARRPILTSVLCTAFLNRTLYIMPRIIRARGMVRFVSGILG